MLDVYAAIHISVYFLRHSFGRCNVLSVHRRVSAVVWYGMFYQRMRCWLFRLLNCVYKARIVPEYKRCSVSPQVQVHLSVCLVYSLPKHADV